MALGEVGFQQRVGLVQQARVGQRISGRRDDGLALITIADLAVGACAVFAQRGHQRIGQRRLILRRCGFRHIDSNQVHTCDQRRQPVGA